MKTSAVPSLLKEGVIVRTRVGTNTVWYENLIYNVQNKTIKLSLLEVYVENILMIGTPIIIKYATEFFEYLFQGVVSNICTDFPAHITVNISKTEELINTRTFPRYDVYLASSIKPMWSDDSHYSVVTNVSLGGMAFLSKHQFDYGEESAVTIFLLHNNIKINMAGKVIRRNIKGNIIDYSMQFIEIDDENKAILSSYLTRKEDDWRNTQNTFAESLKKYF